MAETVIYTSESDTSPHWLSQATWRGRSLWLDWDASMLYGPMCPPNGHDLHRMHHYEYPTEYVVCERCGAVGIDGERVEGGGDG